MKHDEAMERAREMLARGFVMGVSLPGDTLGQPTADRVAELTTLLLRGEVKETA